MPPRGNYVIIFINFAVYYHSALHMPTFETHRHQNIHID